MAFPLALLLLISIIILIFAKPIIRMLGGTARTIENKITTDYDSRTYRATLSNGDIVMFQSVLNLKSVMEHEEDFNVLGEIAGHPKLCGESHSVLVDWEPYDVPVRIEALKEENDISVAALHFYHAAIGA